MTTYQQVDNQVVREDGYIAVQHRNSNPTAIKVNGTVYQFSPRLNVSMAWIAPADLPQVMNEIARICCGQSGKKFHLASIINVNLWEKGTREG